MMTAFALTMTMVVGVFLPALEQMSREAAIAKTETILENLKAGNTSALVKELDDKMAQALPESKLQAAWPAVIGQFGTFKQIDERREGRYQGRQTVELILAFEKNTIVMRTVYDDAGKVGGLVFRPKDQAVLSPAK
jgi:hypothetical protein